MLVELGYIKPTELSVVVRRHFEEIIYSAFEWEDGEWSLAPGQPNQEIVLLDEHPAALILAGVRRKYGPARLARCLGGGGQVFRRAGEGLTAELLPRMGFPRFWFPRFYARPRMATGSDLVPLCMVVLPRAAQPDAATRGHPRTAASYRRPLPIVLGVRGLGVVALYRPESAERMPRQRKCQP